MFYVFPIVKRKIQLRFIFAVLDKSVGLNIVAEAVFGCLNFIVIASLIYLWKSDPGFMITKLSRTSNANLVSYDVRFL